MQFRIRQTFDAPPREVMDAYTDPDLYPNLQHLPKIGSPQVLDRQIEGNQVLMWVRYLFRGDLPAAARRVVDPAKLTWVEAARYDFDALTAWIQLLPDNYADKMTCTGTVSFTADPGPDGRSTRTIEGDLAVRVPLVGGKVEHAIVSGLREHMADEQPITAWWITSRREAAQDAAGEAGGDATGDQAPEA